jgi:hypothetical protein
LALHAAVPQDIVDGWNRRHLRPGQPCEPESTSPSL